MWLTDKAKDRNIRFWQMQVNKINAFIVNKNDIKVL